MDSISQQYSRLHEFPFHLFSICLKTSCWSAVNQHPFVKATAADQVKVDVFTHESDSEIYTDVLNQMKINHSACSRSV